jgi:hypothetical protein
MNSVKIKNPCTECEHCKPNYSFLLRKPEFDKCNLMQKLNSIPTYCEIQRDKTYDLVTQCGSRGNYFSQISTEQKIKTHLKEFLSANGFLILVIVLNIVNILFIIF